MPADTADPLTTLLDRVRHITDRATKPDPEFPLRCSFCGKSQREVKGLVAAGDSGPFICNECVGVCIEVLGDKL
jgi:hypothetical protein